MAHAFFPRNLKESKIIFAGEYVFVPSKTILSRWEDFESDLEKGRKEGRKEGRTLEQLRAVFFKDKTSVSHRKANVPHFSKHRRYRARALVHRCLHDIGANAVMKTAAVLFLKAGRARSNFAVRNRRKNARGSLK